MRTTETDVLVVGAGPAGLTASALLARSGVNAITVTKYPGTANSPRAHITNQRTVEVFRDLGIEEQVRAIATPNELMGNNVWAASFAGQEIARLMTWGSGTARRTDYDSASPSALINAPQHVLEPVILNAARSHGADIRFSTELVGITQDENGVQAVVRERDSGEEYTIAARYAIGADGGRSTVASQLGFPLQAFVELVRFALVVELLIDMDGLQRDFASDAAVLRQIDHTHRATSEDGLDVVVTIALGRGGRDFHHRLTGDRSRPLPRTDVGCIS